MYGLIKILRSSTFKDISFLQITQLKLITFQRYKQFSFMYKYSTKWLNQWRHLKTSYKPPHWIGHVVYFWTQIFGMTWYNGSYQIKKIVKEQLRQENILLYMFASTLKKTNKIWYDEIYKYMILGKGVHFNPQSVNRYILDIWYLSLLYFI